MSNGAHAAVGFEFLGFRLGGGGVGGGLVGEEGGGVLAGLVHQFLGDLLGQFGGALLVIALEGDDFGGGDGGTGSSLRAVLPAKAVMVAPPEALAGAAVAAPFGSASDRSTLPPETSVGLWPRVQPVEIRLVLPS